MGKKRSDSVVYGFLALTTMLWGSQYIANRVLMEAVPSFTLLSLQLILSAIVLAAIQLVRRPEKIEKPRRIAKGDRKYVLLLGLGGYVLSVGLQQLGTKLAGASLASLINCMNPVAICFFAVVLLHERMTAKKVVCIASAVAGGGLHCRRQSGWRQPGRYRVFVRRCAGLEYGQRGHALVYTEVRRACRYDLRHQHCGGSDPAADGVGTGHHAGLGFPASAVYPDAAVRGAVLHRSAAGAVELQPFPRGGEHLLAVLSCAAADLDGAGRAAAA